VMWSRLHPLNSGRHSQACAVPGRRGSDFVVSEDEPGPAGARTFPLGSTGDYPTLEQPTACRLRAFYEDYGFYHAASSTYTTLSSQSAAQDSLRNSRPQSSTRLMASSATTLRSVDPSVHATIVIEPVRRCGARNTASRTLRLRQTPAANRPARRSRWPVRDRREQDATGPAHRLRHRRHRQVGEQAVLSGAIPTMALHRKLFRTSKPREIENDIGPFRARWP